MDKSGGTIDALDDGEYSGSVISLIENGEAFIKRNNKVMWRKTSNSREEMPDGSLIQERDPLTVPSTRRNPVLADVLNRLGYMERKGSGFEKIISGYDKEGGTMENPINILVVEDDTNINNLLKTALEKAGYQVIQAFSGTEAELVLQMQKSVSLVLLDLMLPGISGEEVLKSIRKKGNLPVIILTAKDSLDEKIGLLTQGADDYITKPFELPEVLARIQVQLRHVGRETDSGRLAYKDLVLDKTNYHVKIGGREIPRITKQEFAILELLVSHPRQVFSKEDIFSYAWEEPYMGETKTLDVHISNIRKKLKAVASEEYIETVWGIGYRLHG